MGSPKVVKFVGRRPSLLWMLKLGLLLRVFLLLLTKAFLTYVLSLTPNPSSIAVGENCQGSLGTLPILEAYLGVEVEVYQSSLGLDPNRSQCCC
ncbi:hypothetical protein GBA52_009374 [Prunus armeniaca]|nr:hypothetical protein GBA52_009374 [Prunus armeniaca]